MEVTVIKPTSFEEDGKRITDTLREGCTVVLNLEGKTTEIPYKYKNNILISSGYESSTDVISSIVVLISAGLMLISDKISFLKYSDIIATIIVGILIIRIGYTILKDNISIMLGEQETDETYINKVKKIILKKHLWTRQSTRDSLINLINNSL